MHRSGDGSFDFLLASLSSPPGDAYRYPIKQMKVPLGLKLDDTTLGSGRHALPGDMVRFEYDCRLNRGDQISDSTEYGPYRYRLGCRDCSPAIEYGLMGMRAGGVREVRLPPHLTFVDRQINPEIPAGAVVRYTLRLVEIEDRPWDASMSTRLDITGIQRSG